MVKDKLKEVPHHPGCYIYKNKNNEIIYIGKAKDLRKRMSSYFRPVNNLKTSKLVSEIADFEYILTNSELESLILENKLIKKHSPKYNILLKDDKTYPFIVLTDEKHPRLIKSRSKKIKGTYYGPFSSASFVNNIISYINNHTSLRKCKSIPKQKCIYYDLNLCYAPCIKQGVNSKESVEEVKSLLANDFSKLKKSLVESRNKASNRLEFEEANEYQTLLTQIDEFRVGQVVEMNNHKDFYALDYYKTDDWISLVLLEIVDGIIVNIKQTIIDYFNDEYEAIITYLFQELNVEDTYYMYCPNEELLSFINDIFITHEVKLKKQEREQIDQFMLINAHEYYKNNVDKATKKFFNQKTKGFESLLELSEDYLEYIEMYDISHTQGVNGVGVRITYQDGKKNNKLYRKYKLKTNHNGNDYEAMREVLTRRLSKLDDYVPNLIVVDGGYAHVKLVKEVVDLFNLKIKVIGLSKDEKHKTKAIVNESGQSLNLKTNTALYRFLFNMQEEVHRYAIDYHHLRQTKTMVGSKLDQIPGIGPKRKKKLIETFGDIEKIKQASDEELLEIVPKNIVDILKKEL